MFPRMWTSEQHVLRAPCGVLSRCSQTAETLARFYWEMNTGDRRLVLVEAAAFCLRHATSSGVVRGVIFQ